MALGGTFGARHVLPRLGPCREEAGAAIRFQFDLRADEPQEQAQIPDTEKADETDDRESKKGEKQPPDGGHSKGNEPTGHRSLPWRGILSMRPRVLSPNRPATSCRGVRGTPDAIMTIIRPLQHPVNTPGLSQVISETTGNGHVISRTGDCAR